MKHLPQEELALRHARCRALLDALLPEAGGIMAFGRVNIYYLSGVMGPGLYWLPREGNPLLLVRKGLARARLDNPYLEVAEYRSYSDLARLTAERGVPLSPVIAAEQSALPWALADNLQKRLPGIVFSSADNLLARARAVKSPWELDIMRRAGERHAEAMERLLPRRITPGMTELQVAHITSDIFYSQGSSGISRMSNFGEEMLLGEISAGDNGNYPTFYNGPLGCRGAHPSSPFLGSPETVWKDGQILSLDSGFCLEGYNADKTVCYFAGKERDIPPLMRKAHDVCRDIEADTAEKMRPGAIPLKLYENALQMAKKAGFGEGFMGLGGNKVPFLGHGIGLCIDEWPVLAARFESPLETGMTLAVEPKIGLEGLCMVGTENTWEITENGSVCISGNICPIICVE